MAIQIDGVSLGITDAGPLDKLARKFNQIEEQTYALPREGLQALQLVPVKGGIDKGVLSYTYQHISELGIAELVADGATDLPPVSRAVSYDTVLIKTVGDSFGFNRQEIDAYLYAGGNLEADDANTARRKIDEAADRLLLVGDSDSKVPGLLTSDMVGTVAISTGSAGGTAWSTKTLAEIVADVQSCLDAIFESTKGANGGATVTPDTILLPRSAYVHLTTTYKSDDSDVTLLEALKAVFAPQGLVNWVLTNSANGIGEADTDGNATDRALVYKRAEENVFAVLPLPFEILQPQYRGLNTVFNCRARCGGAVWRRPTTAVYMDGV